MGHRILPTVLAIALLVSARPAAAVKYMQLGDAVKMFVPKDAKVFKQTKSLSDEDRAHLQANYGWKPDGNTWELYVARNGDDVQAYVFVVPEIFNTCFHKYAVGLSPKGDVKEAVIIELTCPRSFPINKKSFLGQFHTKTHEDPLTVKADIDAVTGATLSSEAASTAVRKAVSLHNLWFGGGREVAVSAATRAARAKGTNLIQKAIETGETLKKEGKDGAAQLPPGAQ